MIAIDPIKVSLPDFGACGEIAFAASCGRWLGCLAVRWVIDTCAVFKCESRVHVQDLFGSGEGEITLQLKTLFSQALLCLN